MNLNPGDKITVAYSPYVYKVIRLEGGNVVTKSVGTGRWRTSPLSDVVAVVERAETAADW